MAIETHQTKRRIVYRVVVPTEAGDTKKVVKTFRTQRGRGGLGARELRGRGAWRSAPLTRRFSPSRDHR